MKPVESSGNKKESSVSPVPYSKRGLSVLHSLQEPKVIAQLFSPLSDGTSGLVTFYWNAVKGDFPGLLPNPGAPSTPSEGGAQVQGRSRKA